jgi:hypothetical protein
MENDRPATFNNEDTFNKKIQREQERSPADDNPSFPSPLESLNEAPN